MLLAVANGWCRVVAGRRLDYDDDGAARSIAFLYGDLERELRVEPLNPPVPARLETPAAAVPGIRVAVVDSGVNYLLPRIASRLARDEDGTLIGFDFWDLDARPSTPTPRAAPSIPSATGPAPRR